MMVQALRRHRALGEARAVDAIFNVDRATGQHLVRRGFVRALANEETWHTPHGRDLRTEPLHDLPWPTVVACLNIWNDRPALERTLPTWLPKIDALVVADGAYASVSHLGYSTDGLRELLDALPLPVHVFDRKEPWADQPTKRTALMREAGYCFPGALLLILDADVYLAADGDLHQLPAFDVGWATVTSPMYRRPYSHPSLVRARPDLEYRGRHHWLYAGDRLLTTHQYGGPGFEHRAVPVFLRNERGLGQTAERWKQKQRGMAAQREAEAALTTGAGASDRLAGGREALRIVQVTSYDPGLVAFRLHTALNSTTPHSSVFLRRGKDNPFGAPRQYDADASPDLTKRLLAEADVVHCHLDYSVADSFGVRGRKTVIHHHGTWLRNHAIPFDTLDRTRACLRLVSNLELLSYGKDFAWLPNPVNVARLRRLYVGTYAPGPTFRVAHSPSKRALKGTAVLLSACERLRARGLAIEPVLIENMAHGEGLRLKATCDACFDSFWLGIQCSGLEAAAMGMPVVAGDPTVRERYLEHVGEVPYTFAGDEHELMAVLEVLATDPGFLASETRRVADYALRYHDDAAVALRYLDLLDEAIGWRTTQSLHPESVRPPAA